MTSNRGAALWSGQPQWGFFYLGKVSEPWLIVKTESNRDRGTHQIFLLAMYTYQDQQTTYSQSSNSCPKGVAAFQKVYIRALEIEISIQARFAKCPVPNTVWDKYHMDQEINDCSVAQDMEPVQ